MTAEGERDGFPKRSKKDEVRQASRKGRINVEHGAARRPTIPKNHGTRNRLFQTDDTELSRRTGTGGRTFRTPIRQPRKRTLNDLKLRKAHDEKVAAEVLADAKELAKELKGNRLSYRWRVGNGGRTFGSISTKEIAAEAKKQLGYELDKKKMHCEADQEPWIP